MARRPLSGAGAGAWTAAVLAAAGAHVCGDLAWVTLTGNVLYRPAIGALLADRFDPLAGAAFYAVYLFGMLTFAVAPGLAAGSWRRSLVLGALLGLVAYGTYDLTNQATLKLWSVNVTIIDMSWGAAITALASAIGCAAALMIIRR